MAVLRPNIINDNFDADITQLSFNIVLASARISSPTWSEIHLAALMAEVDGRVCPGARLTSDLPHPRLKARSNFIFAAARVQVIAGG